MIRTVTPADLRTRLRAAQDGAGELAILDAREVGEFGRGHLFWAAPCPLSEREWVARALLPRRATPIICVDGGAGHAERLAAYLLGIGHPDVTVLAGGVPAGQPAGHVMFSGVHVPSKAFGEWVEHHYATESLDPAELDALVRAGLPHVILDSRPFDEFHRMSIPGGICVPGGELAYRARDLAPDPATVIVVNCAGRTRSILGAESLRQAGVPNRVVALRNGTMGWELAGFRTTHGASALHPAGTPRHAAAALAQAQAFAARHGVRRVARAEALGLLAAQDRATYGLDVRGAEEFAAGHLPGFRHAPGGQLVQATDRWVAVRGARLLLACDNGARASMAGAWLRQMGGWEVLVVEGALDGPLELGTPLPAIPEAPAVETVTPEELAACLATGAVRVVQLSRSIAFREGHIPGAVWGIRGRLGDLSPDDWVVAAPDDRLGALAAAELGGGARVLRGGLAAWRGAGLPVEADRADPPDEACADWYLRPYDRNSGVDEAMRDYLRWEVELMAEVERDGDARFGAW